MCLKVNAKFQGADVENEYESYNIEINLFFSTSETHTKMQNESALNNNGSNELETKYLRTYK